MGNDVGRSQEEVQSCVSIDQRRKMSRGLCIDISEFLNHIEVEESVTH